MLVLVLKDDDANIQYLLKVCIVGDSNVGKTSIIIKYCTDKFDQDYKPTLGANFIIKKLEKKHSKIQIWDLAGDDSYNNLRRMYLRGSNGIFICFGLDNMESLSNVEKWMDEIYNVYSRDIPIILIGSKSDLETKTDASIIDERIKILDFPYIRTSAKTGENIEYMFEMMLDSILKKIKVD